MRNDLPKSGFRTFAAAVLLLLLAVASGLAADGAPAENAKSSRMGTQVEKPEPQALIPLTEPILSELDPDRQFSLGLDRLIREDFAPIDHKHLLVATSRLALDGEGRNLLTTLLEARKPIVSRVLIFDDDLPQPGRSPKLDRVLARHPDVRVFERSARNFRPTKGMLDGIEMIVMDIPLRGARFYPEVAFLGAVLEEAGLAGIPVLFLDRPIPVSGLLLEGPAGDPAQYGSATCFLPAVPLPGLTGGELATLFNTYYGLEAQLEVLEMLNWGRTSGYAALLDAYERKGIHPGEELPEWSMYATRSPDSGAWRAGAELCPKDLVAGVREPSGGQPAALLIDPAGFDPDDLARQFNLFRVPGHEAKVTTGTLKSGLIGPVVAVSSNDLPQPIMTSVILWHLAAKKNPAILPPKGEAGLYGTPFIFDSLREGRDPREIQRLWQLNSQYREFVARRDDLLRYPR